MAYAQNGSVNLYYEIHGDGDPVMLVPGLGPAAEAWGGITPAKVKDAEKHGHGTCNGRSRVAASSWCVT